MQPERVVEIRKSKKSLGTGYLIAPRHVLTARHVLKPAVTGTVCDIWPLGAVGDDQVPLAKRKRPSPRKARLEWSSQTRDLAVLAIEGDGIAGIPNATVAFGVAHDDGFSWPCLGSGLPEASGDQERRIEGSMSWVRPELRFDINIGSGKPQQWDAWAGFSGTAIFSGGLLIAVVRVVDESWGGEVLEATPAQFLLEDESFKSYCGESGLRCPVELQVARYNAAFLDTVSARIHQINRSDQLGQIRTILTAIDEKKKTAPLVFVISGVDDDDHRHLIKRIASEPAIRRQLGKNAAPERVIPELFWPGEWSIDPAIQLREGLAAGLWQVIGPPGAAHEVNTDPRIWRRSFEQESSTRAFWIMLRWAGAGPGHAALLLSWLEQWRKLGDGRLVVLFLCIAWDDPPPPLASPIPAFLRRAPPVPDPELKRVVEVSVSGGWTKPVPPLDVILPGDIGQWVDQVRAHSQHSIAEQFDGLRSLLLHFVDTGKRLRPIDRHLGALRSQFEAMTSGARGGGR